MLWWLVHPWHLHVHLLFYHIIKQINNHNINHAFLSSAFYQTIPPLKQFCPSSVVGGWYFHYIYKWIKSDISVGSDGYDVGSIVFDDWLMVGPNIG